MIEAAFLSKVKTLSVGDRLELISALWETFAASEVPVSDEERALLHARVADMEKSPGDESPWSEVQARLQKRLP